MQRNCFSKLIQSLIESKINGLIFIRQIQQHQKLFSHNKSYPIQAHFIQFHKILNLTRQARIIEMLDRDKKLLQCPDCYQKIYRKDVKDHILTCKSYRKKYLNTMTRTIDITSKNDLKFLYAELKLIEHKIQGLFSDSDQEMISNNKNKKDKSPQKTNDIKRHQESDWGNGKAEKQIKLDKFLLINKQKQTESSCKKQSLNTGFGQKQVKNQKQISYLDSLLQNEGIQMKQYDSDQVQCSKCHKRFERDKFQQFVYADLCLHTICKKCILVYLDNQYVKAKGKYKYPCPFKDCTEEIPYYQLTEILGKQKMQAIQNQLISGFTVDLITCVKCKSRFQFMKGKASDVPKLNEQGKKIDKKYISEFAQYRYLCPNCKTQQCRSCQTTPYHLEKTCQQFEILKIKKKCRYCLKVIPLGYTSSNGIRAFDDVCDCDQCFGKTKVACSKINKCGHSCSGFIKQKKCIPCLKYKCAQMKQKQLNGQNQDSYCKICYIQGLGNAPCIKIKCGHIFHYQCIQKRLKTGYFGPRILFTFCNCPLCKSWIQVPEECELNKILRRNKALQNQVKEKALKRLKYQGEDKNKKLTDPSSPYFKDQQKYSMTIYAYFQCFKCKKSYFGGRKNCADAMNQNRQGQAQFKPQQLVCPQCCPISVANCNKHGKQFISFKCKFCCSVAQWFCWGSTHFCDQCHKRQVAGQYLNKIQKQKLPKCPGPGKCPVGGSHGGNGQTKSLGCSLCVNLHTVSVIQQQSQYVNLFFQFEDPKFGTCFFCCINQ